MNKIVVVISCCVLFAGCNRVSNPVLSEPPATQTAVRIQCPQVENMHFPECRAFALVTDQSDQAVTDFKMGNFTVIENGKASVVTKVARVDNDADPLSVAICLDRSGSMAGQATADTNTAAKQFIDALDAKDTAAIIDFSYDAAVTQSFTTDKTLLKLAIDSGAAEGGTALYDAIALGAAELKSRKGRKYILVITDGEDTASSTYRTPELAIEQVNKAGVPAYLIGLGYGVNTTVLQKIADDTQARFFNAPSASQQSVYFTQIQYLMNHLVEVAFRSREAASVRDMDLYINYGSFAQSTRRRYGY